MNTHEAIAMFLVLVGFCCMYAILKSWGDISQDEQDGKDIPPQQERRFTDRARRWPR